MGNKINRILIAGLCMLMLAAVDASAASSRSAVGSWKLNVAQSSYGKMPAPKAEVLVIAVDKPDALQWKLTGASADGKTYFSYYNGAVDSQYHPMGSSESGDTVAYLRTYYGDVKWTVKYKNGKVIETGASQLSANGDTLTLKGTVEGANGKENFVSVFERTQ